MSPRKVVVVEKQFWREVDMKIDALFVAYGCWESRFFVYQVNLVITFRVLLWYAHIVCWLNLVIYVQGIPVVHSRRDVVIYDLGIPLVHRERICFQFVRVLFPPISRRMDSKTYFPMQLEP